MSKRSIADIQMDYQNLCLKAGHLQYQVSVFSKDLDLVNVELRDLNLEAAAVKAASDAATTDTAVEVPTIQTAPESAPEAAPAEQGTTA